MAEPNIKQILSSYQSAMASGSLDTAIHTIERALAAGVTPRRLYLDVLQPSLIAVEVAAGANSAADPAVRSAIFITERVMSMMARRFRGPAHGNGHRVALGCVLGEWQGVEMRMWRDFFVHDGWQATPLGTSLPPARFASLAQQARAEVICVSAGHPSRLPLVAETIRALRSTSQPVTILVGGSAFRDNLEVVQQVGADDWAANAAEALEKANRAVGIGELTSEQRG